VGRRIYFFLFVLCIELIVSPSREIYAHPELQPSSRTDLQQILKEIRSEGQAVPVEVSIADEMEKLRVEYAKLDPLTDAEARVLVGLLGSRFSKIWGQLESNPSPALREEAREVFRQFLAVSLRVDTLTDRIEAWFVRHPKTWFFIGEAIAITGAVLGADLAMREYTLNTVDTVFVAFSTVFGIKLTFWFPGKLWSSVGKRRKLDRLFNDFLAAAKLPRSSFLRVTADMKSLSREVGYPGAFTGCALRLERLRDVAR
jgi:hypothetical protein